MAIKTGDYLNEKDIYIDYPFEQVMFRRVKADGFIYKKFYGQKESSKPVKYNNNLYNDALLSGDEISKEDYTKGKNELS